VGCRAPSHASEADHRSEEPAKAGLVVMAAPDFSPRARGLEAASRPVGPHPPAPSPASGRGGALMGCRAPTHASQVDHRPRSPRRRAWFLWQPRVYAHCEIKPVIRIRPHRHVISAAIPSLLAESLPRRKRYRFQFATSINPRAIEPVAVRTGRLTAARPPRPPHLPPSPPPPWADRRWGGARGTRRRLRRDCGRRRGRRGPARSA
jgi:hypothetical protein